MSQKRGRIGLKLRWFIPLFIAAGLYVGAQILWIWERHEFLSQLNHSRVGHTYTEIGADPSSPDQAAPWPIRALGERGIGFIVFFRPYEQLTFREGAGMGPVINANNYLEGEERRKAVERARRLFPEAMMNF